MRVGHYVDLWMFSVRGGNHDHVLPVHHLRQPSGDYALYHALSVFKAGQSLTSKEQGNYSAAVFTTHFVLCFKVREEYGNIVSRFSAPQKKRYSEFSASHSSKAHVCK